MSEKERKAKTIRAIARECLEKCSGDVKKATEQMIGRVRASRRLRDELTEPLIDSACYETVASIQRSNRTAIWETANRSGEDPSDRFRRFAESSLLDFPLLSGTRLGDGTRTEVSATQHFYAAQSRVMSVRAVWLRMILEKLPETKKVAQVFDNTQLEAMQAAAERMFTEVADAAE